MGSKLLTQQELAEIALIQRILDLLGSEGSTITASLDAYLGTSWRAESYPVGSVFVSVSPTNPASVFGYGTWTAFGTGRVLVGVDVGDTDFDTVEETGGSKTATYTPGYVAP